MNTQVGKLINAYGVELVKVTRIELGKYSVYEVEFPFCPIVFDSFEEACKHAGLYGFKIILKQFD